MKSELEILLAAIESRESTAPRSTRIASLCLTSVALIGKVGSELGKGPLRYDKTLPSLEEILKEEPTCRTLLSLYAELDAVADVLLNELEAHRGR